MEEEIMCKIPDLQGTEVICRCVNPLDKENLKIANVAEANSVIILPPSVFSPDCEVIKLILALRNRTGKGRLQLDIIKRASASTLVTTMVA